MRLIDADRLKRQVEGRSWRAKEKFIELIEASATIKSQTVQLHYGVKHGRWIWDDEGYHCSECFYHAYGETVEVMSNNWNYCPNCGAKMDEEETE